MKKNVIKKIVVLLAVCTVSAFTLGLTGCNAKDFLEEKINQARCEHEFGDVVTVEESTCTKAGYGEKTCPKCNKIEKVKFEKTEHVVIVVDAVAATCTKQGLTSGTKCADCDMVITAQANIPALGHIVVKDKGVEPTCLTSGLSDGEHCSRCNEVLKPQTVVLAKGHNLVMLEGKKPSCREEGLTDGVWCDLCEEVFTEQEVLPMLEHSFKNGVCEVCDLPDLVSYTQVKMQAGDTVVGKWFRLYKGASVNLSNPIVFTCSDDFKGVGGHSTIEILSLTGIEIIVYDEYVDFFISDGAEVNCIFSTEPHTFVFSETSVVSGASANLDGAYLLLPPSDD